MQKMPVWADVVLIPLISLILAAILSALVILGIGEDPIAAVKMMVSGSLGSTYGWGYTLYYATNFMFTGLAVAVAFHARMFNIGGEGQAMLGGLGRCIGCAVYSMAALDACVNWLHLWRSYLGRGMGLYPSSFASKTRQSHRDNHDYV